MLTVCIGAALLMLCGYMIWKRCLDDTTLGDDRLPPGTMGWPFIGETLEFAKKKVLFFKERHQKYGKIYKTSLFGKPIIRVCGADNVRKVTLGENKLVQSSYPASVLRLLGEDSIAMSHGEEHQMRRQKLQKYLCPEYLKNHTPVLASAISQRLRSWCEQPAVDLYAECHKLFVELATKFLVKIDMDEDDVTQVRNALDDFNGNVFSLPVNLPGFGFRKAMKAKATMKTIITRVLNQPSLNNNNDSDELPSLLEGLRASTSGDLDPEREEELMNATIELLFAGAETVSSSGFSMVRNLINNPDILEKLNKEVKVQGLDNLNESPCAHDLKDMTYLQAVVKETLRQAPPVGGAYRTALESFDMEGYTVPKGWSVVFSIRETQHKDDSISDPLSFNPDQWLHPDFSLDKYAYTPFGAGPRMCPGQTYAKLILKLFAFEFARTCSASMVQDSDIIEWPTPRPVDKVLVNFKHITS